MGSVGLLRQTKKDILKFSLTNEVPLLKKFGRNLNIKSAFCGAVTKKKTIMALQTEEHDQFKICGLCSQLVDESVLITAQMKSFLQEFLGVSENSLPQKTCLECYKSAIECKRFKEACKKSINKLEQKNISSSMILGKSEQSKVPVSSVKAGKNDAKSKVSAADTMKNLKNATQPTKKNKILESLGLDPDKIDIGIETTGRPSRSQKAQTGTGVGSSPVATSTPAPTRSSRRSDPVLPPPPPPTKSKSPAAVKKKSSTGDGTQKCHVIIKKVDKKLADEILEQLNVTEVQKILGKTPAKGSKRGRSSIEPEPEVASIADTPPPAKRGRSSAPETVTPTPNPTPTIEKPPPTKATPTPTKGTPKQTPAKAQKTPNKSTPPAATAATPTGSKNRSSFGRVRNTTTKNSYVYGEDMDTSADPIEVEPEPSPPPPPSASKRGKPPAKAAATPNKKEKPIPKSKQE